MPVVLMVNRFEREFTIELNRMKVLSHLVNYRQNQNQIVLAYMPSLYFLTSNLIF